MNTEDWLRIAEEPKDTLKFFGESIPDYFITGVSNLLAGVLMTVAFVLSLAFILVYWAYRLTLTCSRILL